MMPRALGIEYRSPAPGQPTERGWFILRPARRGSITVAGPFGSHDAAAAAARALARS